MPDNQKDEELLQKMVNLIESREMRLRNVLLETGREVLDIAASLSDGSLDSRSASDALLEVAKKIVRTVHPSTERVMRGEDE